ncbi:MAG: DUF1801 domain-containing protein [Gammaproteobacteria bacterium]|nr:DUF1801 domain-containing protein [Gammaproteobacteria bacterium]MDP2140832.1 DUF1801 domain-containing protein [Gammaproteobacteria bacterium]MDP2349425.1 DUF1801 domain-containing protein [Gammaproteobacteria bacterium]
MTRIFRFTNTLKHDPAVEAWLLDHSDPLGALALQWFQAMRDCGADVHELMHDGCPTACVDDAAFAYVGAYKDHVSIGFFNGSELADPNHLLEGAGKFMRHVKIRPGSNVDAAVLLKLINASYTGMKRQCLMVPSA